MHVALGWQSSTITYFLHLISALKLDFKPNVFTTNDLQYETLSLNHKLNKLELVYGSAGVMVLELMADTCYITGHHAYFGLITYIQYIMYSLF